MGQAAELFSQIQRTVGATQRVRELLREPEALQAAVTADLSASMLALKKRIAGAGAIQQSAESRTSVHHLPPAGSPFGRSMGNISPVRM